MIYPKWSYNQIIGNMVRDLIALDDSSKVWLYQADKVFTDNETGLIRKRLL